MSFKSMGWKSPLDHHVMKELVLYHGSHLKRSRLKGGQSGHPGFLGIFLWRVNNHRRLSFSPHLETKVSQFCDRKNPAPHLWWHHISGVVSGGFSSGYWKMDLNASWWGKKPGWLEYIGDEILPRLYRNHYNTKYKDPYWTTTWNAKCPILLGNFTPKTSN